MTDQVQYRVLATQTGTDVQYVARVFDTEPEAVAYVRLMKRLFIMNYGYVYEIDTVKT